MSEEIAEQRRQMTRKLIGNVEQSPDGKPVLVVRNMYYTVEVLNIPLTVPLPRENGPSYTEVVCDEQHINDYDIVNWLLEALDNLPFKDISVICTMSRYMFPESSNNPKLQIKSRYRAFSESGKTIQLCPIHNHIRVRGIASDALFIVTGNEDVHSDLWTQTVVPALECGTYVCHIKFVADRKCRCNPFN